MRTYLVNREEEWIIYGQSVACLSEDDKSLLEMQVLMGHKRNQAEIPVRGEEFMGTITRGKFISIGDMVGRLYEGTLHVPSGREKFSIILNEPAQSAYN